MEDQAIEEHALRVQLGVKVERFFKSTMGKLLIFRVGQEKDRLKEELVKADPGKPYEVARLQGEYNALCKVDLIFGQAILEGRTSQDILNDLDQ